MTTDRTTLDTDARVQVRVPATVFSGSTYSVTVEVLNVSQTPIRDIRVEPVEVPGTVINRRQEGQRDRITFLRDRFRRIAEEMRTQAEYAMLVPRASGRLGRLYLRIYVAFFDFIKIMSSRMRSSRLTLLPAWSRRSLDIYGIEEAEDLQHALIDPLNESHPVKLSWNLAMAKLIRCNDEIKRALQEIRERKREVRELPPGGVNTTSFQIRSPLLFTQRKAEAVFQVYYDSDLHGGEQILSARSEVVLLAAPLSVIVGAVVGAILGFLVRFVYLTEAGVWFSNAFWQDLVASLALGVLLAVLVRKTPESRKPLTAEDFLGGVLVGSIAGMFSSRLIALFETILTG